MSFFERFERLYSTKHNRKIGIKKEPLERGVFIN